MDETSISSNPEEERSTGEQKEVRWEEVATTAGITAAQILVGRLQSEGIPARAWQEGAGQATGLVVGLLGTGHVVVPEEFAEQARAVLDDVDEFDDDEYDDLDDLDDFYDDDFEDDDVYFDDDIDDDYEVDDFIDDYNEE